MNQRMLYFPEYVNFLLVYSGAALTLVLLLDANCLEMPFFRFETLKNYISCWPLGELLSRALKPLIRTRLI